MSIKISYKPFLALVFICLFLGIADISAQNDTIFYNSKWKPTTKDSASFYRSPIQKEGDLYNVKDYYMSGKVQMNAFSKSKDSDVWEGKVTWYNEDGSLFQQGHYKNNRLNGDFVTLMSGKQLTAIYKNGYIIGGKQNTNIGNKNMYVEHLGDTIRNVIYDKDIKGVRYERYGTKDKFEVYSKFYDNKGAYLGKKTSLENGEYNGINVVYCWNPMQVQEVTYYRKGRRLNSTTYHTNGKVRGLFKQEPQYSKTFYDRKGKELGEITYQMDRDYLKPENGTEIYFVYGKNGGASSTIQTVRRYKDGLLLEEEVRYKNQTVKSKTTYKKGGKELMLSFDREGNEIARMRYDNYNPVEGKEIFKDRTATYSDGKLVKAVNFYYETEKKFSVKTPFSETYFDKNGEILGILQLDTTQNYSKPLEGKRYYNNYEGGISSIEEYKNGFVIERITFRSRLVGEKKSLTTKKVEQYATDSYNKNREINYYSNGEIQSDIHFKGYDKISGIYYDFDGNKVGTYDYKTEDGTLYEFFADSDKIKSIEERSKGKLLRAKRYNYGKNTKYGAINPVLEEDIDIDCCSKFYNRDGVLIAECTFKNQIPWEGEVYDVSARTLFTIKEGKRNGTYKKLDYDESILEEGQFVDDKEDGIFKIYNYKEVLLRKEQYTQGELHGQATYFSPETGMEIASMSYKNGLPWEGERILATYGKRKPEHETYKDGVLIKRISYDDNGKRISNYIDGLETETTAYYKDSDKKRLSYSVKGSNLNGTVVRYDLNGKEEYKAEFDNGKLKSGIVIITGGNVRGNPEYIMLTRKPDTLAVKLMGQNDKVLFTAEENLVFGSATVFMQNLDIYRDYLGPNRLY